MVVTRDVTERDEMCDVSLFTKLFLTHCCCCCDHCFFTLTNFHKIFSTFEHETPLPFNWKKEEEKEKALESVTTSLTFTVDDSSFFRKREKEEESTMKAENKIDNFRNFATTKTFSG